MKGLPLFPIGSVRSPIREMTDPDRFREIRSEIHLQELPPEVLNGLEPGKDILVLFWFDRLRGFPLQVHPRGDLQRALKGVLATCSPQRPNPIGATRCCLEAVEGTTLHVKGLDAVDGTPVLDIKPFIYARKEVDE